MFIVGLALCLPMTLLPQVAVAQSAKSPRPYRGLFGERERDTKRQPLIDFTLALSDAYDTGSEQSGNGSISGSVRPPGAYSNVDAAVKYAHARGKRRLTMTASDAVRYEPQLQHLLASTYQGYVTYTSPVRRRGHLDASQGVAYTPYYQLELFPTLAADATQPQSRSTDYAIAKQPAYTYTTGLGFTQDLGRRSSLQVGYERRSVVFTNADTERDLLTDGVSVRLARRGARYARFHIAAATRAGRYGQTSVANRTRIQEIEAGVDYARRGTSISLSSGSSFIPDAGTIHYRMTGNAALRMLISRRWTTHVQYNRALRFVEALSYPLFSDSVSAGLTGQLTRRLNVGTSFGYSNGDVGLMAQGGTYGTYSGSTQLTVPLTRHYAFYSEYQYYHYRFAEGAFLDALPPRLDRHTVRVGLKLWFPVLN